ncbi:unnamed protein product, partial [Cyprideis torosa]
MDWYSNLKKITEETRCLMDTMLKWDQESYKNPPCLLDGGYEKWLHMYPHVTTNSRVSTFPSSSSSIPNGGIMDLSKDEANQLSVEEENVKLVAEVGAARKLGVSRAKTTGYASNGNPQDKNCGVHVQKGACGYNSIIASELYRVLSCSTPSSETMTVLIMDCRKEADFEASHIRTVVKAGNRHQVISIPKAILTPGLTPAQVDKQLPTRSWGPWRSRHDCDLLVVMDWYSNLKKITEETRCLMDTMLK